MWTSPPRLQSTTRSMSGPRPAELHLLAGIRRAALRRPDGTHAVGTTPAWPKSVCGCRFSALKLKIAHARRGRNAERALREGRAFNVVEVDVSFKEPLRHVHILRLTGGGELLSCGLIEIAVEKYRALLQQKARNHNRRQDVFDLDMLIRDGRMKEINLEDFLDALVEKCASAESRRIASCSATRKAV